MTRGVISLVSGGMSDHFRRMGTVEMPHMSTRGLLFAVMVIVYTFFYLISFRLMMGVEQSIMGLEVDEDDNAGHEGLHSAEAEVVVDSEHAGENPNSEEREQSDS
ncbi:hypothetical protein PVC01_050034800 [Plasmodium vivax]|uniref:(malaria parasite P. vivax) hypothetical protein n=1 Tax=Plasmodium vivax TaxID=5855 RepID=A0A1G4GTZ5_PLAVI|nr:unnamed protein product [Plasmodium vivax]CAI7719009.1 hypothetical protein PVPAM_050040100 [Plasmodium vivax]SCO66051.1 hypothetical protein PVT01_050035400 [Plasmodium vivax]SCO71482.1 hypothetical protein PVC01_050034800 [Plasmodium vivax]